MKEEKSLTYDDVTLVHTKVFKLVGFYPPDKGDETIFDHCFLIFCHAMMVIYWSMHVGYEIRMITHGTVEVTCIFESVICHGLMLSYAILQGKRKYLLELMNTCRELWQRLIGDEGRILEIFQKEVIYLRHYFLWTALASIGFHVIVALTIRLPPAIVGGKERRMLPFKYYVDVYEGPFYFVTFVLQVLACLNLTAVVIGLQTVGPFLIMMACGCLRVIHERLLSMGNLSDISNIENNNLEASVKQKLIKLSTHDVLSCVTFHQKIMEFCEKIEEFTRSLYMVQITCTAYNISLVGLQILQNDPNSLKYIPLLLFNGLQLFSCQWFSEHLIKESEDLANAAYIAAMTHPEYERDTNRMLLFMIIRAEKYVQITAGGFIKLSLETFQRMFMNAISFLTLLRSFKV